MQRDWNAISSRLAREALLPIAQAARLIPTNRGERGHTSASALCRWILHGKGGIYLDGVRMGGGWLTSREALARFAAAISGQREPAPSIPSDTERARRAAAAMDRIRARRANEPRARSAG